MYASCPAGCLLVVSTHSKEIHEEVHSYQCLDCCITDMAYCLPLNKAGDTYIGINPRPAASDLLRYYTKSDNDKLGQSPVISWPVAKL